MAEALSIPYLLVLLLLFLVQPSQPMNNIVVDGLAEWKGPTIHVGDSLVFKHKHHLQNLYLFDNKRAFDLCSFSLATLIYDGSRSTHYTWHPARPGYYYFSTRDSSRSCEEGEKLPVRVITADPSPGFAPTLAAPPPTAGGDFPSHGWAISSPSSTPTPAPEAASSSSGPWEPRKGHAPSPVSSDGGIPFISSNPAVPLPNGETDSASILPLPSPGDGNQGVGQASMLRVGTSLLVFMTMPSFGLLVETYFLFGAFL
ncbi:uclacyanin-3-like [Phoenix dactylifera]|uniref:Uclacyanin-3-like n=1 Tax=Phoenix dactylifera TaxID=42345 RepID=A0A8B7BM87_PHODC|nr:uclacyanin-3-like [Phoenix dactylifera]